MRLWPARAIRTGRPIRFQVSLLACPLRGLYTICRRVAVPVKPGVSTSLRFAAATCCDRHVLGWAMALPQLLSLIELLPEFGALEGGVPGAGGRCVVGGLHGSSDAVLIAGLAGTMRGRFFVVVSDDIADSERWLADLTTLVEPETVAFYPPRESFGEAEAPAEIAAERGGTLGRIGRADH